MKIQVAIVLTILIHAVAGASGGPVAGRKYFNSSPGRQTGFAAYSTTRITGSHPVFRTQILNTSPAYSTFQTYMPGTAKIFSSRPRSPFGTYNPLTMTGSQYGGYYPARFIPLSPAGDLLSFYRNDLYPFLIASSPAAISRPGNSPRTQKFPHLLSEPAAGEARSLFKEIYPRECDLSRVKKSAFEEVAEEMQREFFKKKDTDDDSRKEKINVKKNTIKSKKKISGNSYWQAKPENTLWRAYRSAYKVFKKKNGGLLKEKLTLNVQRGLKEAFVKTIVDELDTKKATTILMALTAYGEAREQGDSEEEKRAEMASVTKLILNRANTNYRTNASMLKDIALPKHPVIGAIFSDKQFTCWNTNWDVEEPDTKNFKAMIHGTDPSKIKENKSNLKLFKMALNVTANVQKGLVKFSGGLENPKTRHIHASTMPQKKVNWARGESPLDNPTVQFLKVEDGEKVPDGNPISVKSHLFYRNIA